MKQSLSTHLLTQADELQAIAHLVARHDGQLAARIVLQACRLGLASGAARTLERELRAARAATIAEILAPVLARPTTPGGTQ